MIYLKRQTVYHTANVLRNITMNFKNHKPPLLPIGTPPKKKYDEYCEKLNSVKDKKSINKAIEALEKGLKSKIERQLDLQNEIIDLQTRLLDGTTKEKYVKNDGSEAEFERGLTPTEIANYKKVIVMLNAELSKMAGEYAPAKTENRNVDKNGDDVADPIAKAVALGLVTIK